MYKLFDRHIFKFLLGYILRSGIAEIYGNSVFNLLNCQAVFQAVAPFSIPTSRVGEFQFLPILASTSIVCLFHCSHSNGCEVVSHCGFDFYFADG